MTFPTWQQAKRATTSLVGLCAFAVLILLLSEAFAEERGSSAAPPERDDDVPAAFGPSGDISVLERREVEEEKALGSAFAAVLYRQNYFLFATYDSDPNRETYEFSNVDAPENFEVKFQLSFKVLLWEQVFDETGDLVFGYTQRSFWQLYDKALSSPFRETNYEPEIFLRFDTDFNLIGLRHRRVSIGLNHQSNGRGRPLSRSWNRLYAEFLAERGRFVLSLKPWFRIPEAAAGDDNPDIERFMGYGELSAAFRRDGHVFSLMLRNNLRWDGNRGAFEFGWSFPVTRVLRGYVQYFCGYGESLVDYNDASNRIGLGIMLNDFI